MPLDTWDDAFHTLWTRSADRHGLRESADPAAHQALSQTLPRWPRTRGVDALAIASTLDPLLRITPIEAGGDAVDRRWRHCARELTQDAAHDLVREYRHNQSFWYALASAIAYLASIDAPVPERLWRSLLADLDAPEPPRRNIGVIGEKLHLAAISYDELWRAQQVTLAKLRGADVREVGVGVMGGRMTVPRTTSEDVRQLATYWTQALAQIQIRRHTIGLDGPQLVTTLGLDGEIRRWRATLADFDTYARLSHMDAVYPRNEQFWRASASLSVTLAVIADQPAPFELALDTVATRPVVRNSAHYDSEGTFETMWDKMHDDLVRTRDADVRDAPAGQVGRAMKIPRTTNADIVQLAGYWNTAWQHLDDRRRVLGMEWLSNLPSQQGLDGQENRWKAVMKDVNEIAKPGTPTDLYPKNHEFWREAHTLAVTLDLFKEAPTKVDLAIDVARDIPDRIGDVIQDVASAVGDVAKKAGKGLLSGLGTQLLIGGGLVVGLVLLLRRSKPAAELAAAVV